MIMVLVGQSVISLSGDMRTTAERMRSQLLGVCVPANAGSELWDPGGVNESSRGALGWSSRIAETPGRVSVRERQIPQRLRRPTAPRRSVRTLGRPGSRS